MSDLPIFKVPALRLGNSGLSGPSFHERLLDSLYDGVYFVDNNRVIQYWNKGAEMLTGYLASEMVGRNCAENILAHVNEAGCALCLNGCPLSVTIADGVRRESEIYLRHRLGHRIPVSVRVAPIANEAGEVIGAVEVFSDLTAKKNVERRIGELESIAFLDSLTGLPNRRYVEMKVQQAIQEVNEFDRKVGLLMIDIDDFKTVNDHHGHDVGDAAIRAVCQTLTHNLRSGDTLGRWGGDELLVVVTDVDEAALKGFAERCRVLVAGSSLPGLNKRIKVTISLGGAPLRKGETPESAIKRADEAMYKSKVNGRNRVTLG